MKNINLRNLYLSAIAAEKILKKRLANGKTVYINPTVTAAKPICLAIVDPNVIKGATPVITYKSVELCIFCKLLTYIIDLILYYPH